MPKMLQSYSISNKKKGTYRIKFKVEKGVKVAFKVVGDINEVHLKYDSLETDQEYDKNYIVKGPLKLQFFQYESLGKEPGVPPGNPIIDIHP